MSFDIDCAMLFGRESVRCSHRTRNCAVKGGTLAYAHLKLRWRKATLPVQFLDHFDKHIFPLFDRHCDVVGKDNLKGIRSSDGKALSLQVGKRVAVGCR